METKYDKVLTEASSGTFSASGATLSFSSTGINITPTSGDCYLNWDPSLLHSPYLQPHLAHKWGIEVGNGSYASGSVRLTGIDTLQRTLSSFGSGGVVLSPTVMPSGSATSGYQYSGSWGQDWGCLFITDEGVDLFSEGRSVLTYSDEEESLANNLLGGKTLKSLRVYFSGAATGIPIALSYPRIVSDEDPVLIHEARQFSSVIRKKASGIRWGQLNWWNYITNSFNNPPTWLRPGSQCTVLDWLCTKRILEGTEPTSGLNAELATLYNDTERGVLDWGYVSDRQSVAYYTTAFIAQNLALTKGAQNKVLGILSNTFSEVPPLPHLPRRARGEGYVETGDFVQESWTWAIEKRRLICSEAPVDIQGPSGIVTSPEGPFVEGWNIRGHNTPVNGMESLGGWSIVGQSASGLTSWATATPWHSYYNTMPFVRADYQPFIFEDHFGRWGKVSTTSAGVSGEVLYHHSYTRPFQSYAYTTTVGTGWAPVVLKDEVLGREYVQFISPGTGLVLARSDDFGKTFTPVTLVSGSVSQHAGAFNAKGEYLLAYHAGTSLFLRHFNAPPTGSNYTNQSTISTTNTSGVGVCAWESEAEGWAAFLRTGRDLITYVSFDNAKSWTALGSALDNTGKTSLRLTSDSQGRLVRSWRNGAGTLGFQVWTSSGSSGAWLPAEPGATVVFEGIPLVTQTLGYGNLRFAEDEQNTLVLTCLPEGSIVTQEFICNDYVAGASTATFLKVT